jgi:hypothetical protein
MRVSSLATTIFDRTSFLVLRAPSHSRQANSTCSSSAIPPSHFHELTVLLEPSDCHGLRCSPESSRSTFSNVRAAMAVYGSPRSSPRPTRFPPCSMEPERLRDPPRPANFDSGEFASRLRVSLAAASVVAAARTTSKPHLVTFATLPADSSHQAVFSSAPSPRNNRGVRAPNRLRVFAAHPIPTSSPLAGCGKTRGLLEERSVPTGFRLDLQGGEPATGPESFASAAAGRTRRTFGTHVWAWMAPMRAIRSRL